MDMVIQSLQSQGFNTSSTLVPPSENQNAGKTASAPRVVPTTPGSGRRHRWGLNDYKLIFPSLFNNKFFNLNKLYNNTVGKAFKFINGDLRSNIPSEDPHVPFQSDATVAPLSNDNGMMGPTGRGVAEVLPDSFDTYETDAEDVVEILPSENDDNLEAISVSNSTVARRMPNEGGVGLGSADASAREALKVAPNDNLIENNMQYLFGEWQFTPSVVLKAEHLYTTDTPFEPYKHRWAITLQKEGKYSIENPYHEGISGFDHGSLVLPAYILPCYDFRFSTYKADYTDIPLPDFTFQVPGGFSRSPTLSLSIFNDNTDAVRRYIRQYKASVIPGRKTVRPYKDSCSKLCIYIYEPNYNQIYKYAFAVIPELSDPDTSARGENNVEVTFNIYGEY